MPGALRLTMAIPATNGLYADEILYCQMTTSALDRVKQLSVAVEDPIPAGSSLELELLQIGGDPVQAGDWISFPITATASGLYEDLSFAEWLGVRIKGKSGGTAGDLVLNAVWL